MALNGNDDPMGVAFAEARAAEGRGETPIGAALARGGKVIASAGNRTRGDSDPTAHAEMVVLRQAAASLGAHRLTDCDLYVTLEPARCAPARSATRGCAGSITPRPTPRARGRACPRFFSQATCLHAPEVYGGIRESEAAAMLRAFFAARRG